MAERCDCSNSAAERFFGESAGSPRAVGTFEAVALETVRGFFQPFNVGSGYRTVLLEFPGIAEPEVAKNVT